MDMDQYRHPNFKYAFIRPNEGRQMPSKGNINIVHDEQIWRDHIRTGLIKDMLLGECVLGMLSRLAVGHQIESRFIKTIAVKAWEAKWGFTKDIYPEMYSQANQIEGEKQGKVKSEKKKFPETRQKEYGWREPNELYKKLSGHARPVQSIHKNLKWPVDGCY